MASPFDHVFEELRGAWRFRRIAVATAWGIAALGWAFVFALPQMFEAKARVFVDTSSSLKPALGGLVVDQYADSQLNYVRQSLLGGPELEKIARDTGLLAPSTTDIRKRMSVMDDLRQNVQITVMPASEGETNPGSGGSIYGVVYKDGNRDRSLKVVNALLNTLIDNTLGGKRAGSQDAQKFLEARIVDAEEQLRATEDRLAAFKKSNVTAMPSEQGGYFARLQTEMDAVKASESALSVANSRRNELGRQLRGESAVTASAAYATPGAQGTSGASGDVLSRIRETQARLDELLLRFTDKHPGVIAAQDNLRELKRRRAAEVDSLRRGDLNAIAASGASLNPVFQSIQLALNQTEVEIATLRRQLGDHRSTVASLRSALDTMPGIEAAYSRLNRDYEVNKTQYNALLTQLEKAKLGQAADNTGSMRFEIVEPPNAEFQPVSPNRFLLILAVLAMALGAGGGIAYLLNLLHPVFWSKKTLADFAGVEVFGAVSPAFPEAIERTNRRELVWCSAAGAGLVLMAVVVLALGHVLPGLA
jgi:polysaccharide chain length determinant protein (PEP-CTERM system associated)